MKRFLLFAGLAATALSFVGCNKEADVRGLGKKTAELILTTVDTRTINDGMNTKWKADDALTVFYAPAGTSDYSANTQFTITDTESGLAKGEVELTADSYDWYLLYPYTSQITDPSTPTGDDGKRRGYLYFGCGSKQSQTQTGLDNMDHVAGSDLPMVGLAKGVSASETPQVAMKHLTSLVKINVTNVYEKAITITGLSFTAPVDIIGTYYVDFSGNEVKMDPSGENYVSATANLKVEDAGTLASGKTASFYIPIKPFEASSGNLLTVEIMASEGTCKAEMNTSKAYSFEAGHVKTLNVSYEKPDDIKTLTVADLVEAATKSQSFSGELAGATVTFVSGKNAFMQDDKNGILVYMSDHGLNAGDFVSGTVSGSGSPYKNLPEITSFTYSSAVPGTVPAPIELTLSQLLDNFDSYISRYVKLTGVTATSAFTSRNATLEDGSQSIVLRDQKSGLTIEANSTYDIIGFPCIFNDTKQMGVWLQDNIIKTGGGPAEGTITVPRTKLSLYVGDVRSLEATTNSTASITYVSSDSSIASVDSDGNVTAVAEGETTITLTVPEVPGKFTAAEKEVTITVSPQSGTVGGTWTKQALSSISNGAQFVLVSSKSEQPDYAMSNDGTGSKQPMAVEVSISGSNLSSVSENMVWTLEKSGSSYIFHPGSNAEAWLYCTSNNNGLRTGTGETNLITLDSASGYLTMTDTKGVTRFIGVYYDNKDWRSYTSAESNIKEQTFTFFVKQ